MPRLIVLNGMPAAGKTTLARRYAAAHPMTLVLELDLLRRLLGRWEEDPVRAGLLARSMSVEMARAHLHNGLDVVVPQFLARPQFLDQLRDVARSCRVGYLEVVLSENRDELVRRFQARTAAAAEPAHRDAARLVADAGGVPALHAMHERLLQLLASRPHVVVLANPSGRGDEAYQRLTELIAELPNTGASSGQTRGHEQ